MLNATDIISSNESFKTLYYRDSVDYKRVHNCCINLVMRRG